MSKLIAWKTPFASASFPSVWVSMDRGFRTALILVDAAQQWQMRFEYIAGLKICDESYDDNTRFHIDGNEQDLCSYLSEGSSWLNEFNFEMAEAYESGKLMHYVLLGGDYNVKVLALGDVEITPKID